MMASTPAAWRRSTDWWRCRSTCRRVARDDLDRQPSTPPASLISLMASWTPATSGWAEEGEGAGLRQSVPNFGTPVPVPAARRRPRPDPRRSPSLLSSSPTTRSSVSEVFVFFCSAELAEYPRAGDPPLTQVSKGQRAGRAVGDQFTTTLMILKEHVRSPHTMSPPKVTPLTYGAERRWPVVRAAICRGQRSDHDGVVGLTGVVEGAAERRVHLEQPVA